MARAITSFVVHPEGEEAAILRIDTLAGFPAGDPWSNDQPLALRWIREQWELLHVFRIGVPADGDTI